MLLVVARERNNGTWTTGPVVLGDLSIGYQSKVALALNCPFGDNLPTDCDAFALIARSDGTAVQLWQLRFVSDPDTQAVLPTPILVAERTAVGPFSTCFVPGWAWGDGLAVAGISVDNPTGMFGPPTSRWSFAYNRLGTGYFTSASGSSQCGFDSTTYVVNSAAPRFDVVGRRGEYWWGFSWGAYSRTGLALTSVWNPDTGQLQSEVRSTIRTLHPRGSALLANQNTYVIQHSLYGDDAVGLSTTDGTTWSIQRVQP